jgi:hypothetical protein
MEIELQKREVPVGDFSVDLLGREIDDDKVIIIENQLAPTDHSHLGQLLTYASGLEAAYIVWITPQFRDEHRRALDWLNEVTREGIDFFGVEIELLRIAGPSGPSARPRISSLSPSRISGQRDSRILDRHPISSRPSDGRLIKPFSAICWTGSQSDVPASPTHGRLASTAG